MIELFGFEIETIRRSDIERRIEGHLAASGFSLLHIATINPEYIVAACRDDAFNRSLRQADMTVPDGIGIVLAARAICGVVVERLTGVDLVELILTAPFEQPPRVFLLGNPASISELHGRFPTRIVGRWGDGRSEPEDDAASIARITERGANVVLVGYGAPGQVRWIERNRTALAEAGVRIAIGVGGALDFVAGTVGRAPQPVRRLGLEWAYRLVQEPWRWRRQIALPVFAGMVVRAWLSNLGSGRRCACRILSHDDDSTRHQSA